MRFLKDWSIILVASLLLACQSIFSSEETPLPLINKPDLVYVGAFRVPDGDSDADSFHYGGRAIAYNQARDSLLMTGHKHYQKTAEISIPEIVNSSRMADLETAKKLGEFTDLTDDKLDTINPNDPNSKYIGGQLVYRDRFLVNVYSSYDGAGTQRTSLFIRGFPLKPDLKPSGPIRIGRDAHLTSAYMATIPDEWQEKLGGTVLVGNCCRSIIGFQSQGPSVSAFDPDTSIGSKAVDAQRLLAYGAGNPLGGGSTTMNPFFNLTTRVDGVVFPDATRSVLFFGKHGIGNYCYGEAEACGDPANIYKGTHAYPYVYQVWAYDADDLARGKKSAARNLAIQPYAVWTFSLPFEKDGTHEIGGAAYDKSSSRIFISQVNGDKNNLPVVHVFRVQLPAMPN